MAVLSVAGIGYSPIVRMQVIAAQTAQRVRKTWIAFCNRRAVHQLYGYDERMLKDIGLLSSDLDAALTCGLGEDPSRHLASVAAGRGRKRS